ncbi:22512_t:CDS:1, partial [Cetraspora pellucida]
ELATKKLDLGTSVKKLQCIEVTNIKYKVCGPLETHLIDNPKFELDLSKTILFLKQQGYYIEYFKVPTKFA